MVVQESQRGITRWMYECLPKGLRYTCLLHHGIPLYDSLHILSFWRILFSRRSFGCLLAYTLGKIITLKNNNKNIACVVINAQLLLHYYILLHRSRKSIKLIKCLVVGKIMPYEILFTSGLDLTRYCDKR